MDLLNKNALVTGAARRVGREIALALARRGVNIAVHYHNSRAEAVEVAREIETCGVRAQTFRCDLTRLAELEGMVREVNAAFPSLEILVNNASVFYPTPLETVSEQQWDDTLNANLKAPFFLSTLIGRRMIEAGIQGKIVNIADWAGERPYRNYVPYCISKAGLIAMTRGLAKTLAPSIGVMAIAPGPVLPPETLSAEEMSEVMKRTPLARIGAPRDVAQAVIFVLADGDYMTGTTIFVDGGRSIY